MTEEGNEVNRRREEADGAVAAGTGSSQAAAASGVIMGSEIARSRGGVPIEVDARGVQRKAEEEGKREGKKSEDESEERGLKRSLDGWDEYAKRLGSRLEQKVAEAERVGAGMDVVQLEILSLLEKLDGSTHDASSGKVLDEELIKKARMIEIETFKKHGVYAEVSVEEKPIRVEWVDVNKGYAKHPEHRSS